MATLKINRETALPGVLEANSLYFVSNGDPYTELYVTGNTNTVVRRIINESDVNALIASALSGANALEVVADITARDALSPAANVQALVLDASADATVASGAATYVYDFDNTTWVKISEAESLDVVLDWSNIQNGPTSTPAQIDSAVTDSHTHTNKTQLDKIGENGTGDFTYDGDEYVQSGSTAW